MPTTFRIQIHNFLQPTLVFWWMSRTVLLAVELKLRLAWDMPMLLFCCTWVRFEQSGPELGSPHQTGSSGVSLTLPAVRLESQKKAPVHLSPRHALRLPAPAGLRAAWSGWPLLWSCLCLTLPTGTDQSQRIRGFSEQQYASSHTPAFAN